MHRSKLNGPEAESPLAAVTRKSDQVLKSGSRHSSSFPLPAPTKQTQRTEPGGEKGERGWKRGGGRRRRNIGRNIKRSAASAIVLRGHFKIYPRSWRRTAFGNPCRSWWKTAVDVGASAARRNAKTGLTRGIIFHARRVGIIRRAKTKRAVSLDVFNFQF